MKRREISIPVMSRASGAAFEWGAWVGTSWVAMVEHSLLWIPMGFTTMAYASYMVWRYERHDGKPLAIGIGAKPLPLPPPPIPKLEKRPAAFPPEPHQCYVCGLYDEQRLAVFGKTAHLSCEDWLGKWHEPVWRIYHQTQRPQIYSDIQPSRDYAVYGSNYVKYRYGLSPDDYMFDDGVRTLASVSGWLTKDEVLDLCRTKYADKELLYAKRGHVKRGQEGGEDYLNLRHLNKEPTP
jgi:hypothetical protein